MKSKFVAAVLALMMSLFLSARAAAQPNPTAAAEAPAPTPLQADIIAVLEKVDAKLKSGQVSEAALADEFATFDQLLTKHKDAKPEELAMVLIYKAMIYLQVFENFDQAALALNKLKADYPKAPQMVQVDEMLLVVTKQQAASKIQKQLEVGKVFPDFEEKDLKGEPVSVAKYKGNVVLLDFWATWCGPCVDEMPNVIALYKKYQPRGFEIIGISLDRDAAALNAYLEKNKMTWPQIFDGKFWDAKLAEKYGVTSIPFTVLLNADGKIVGKNLRGPALEAEVAKLLGP
jgi:thiol-disulfide isomerase/thioredoxin